MNIVVKGNKVKVTPALKSYAEEKIMKFEKYLSSATEVIVTLSVQKRLHKAEVHIMTNGVIIQAESVTEELYSAIDEVSAKIAIQVKKVKDKITTKRKAASGKTRVVTVAPIPPAEKEFMIKRKKMERKPMSPDEAAAHLDILGREFHVFTNDQSGELNVIYKMEDGNFGLIEPSRK